MPPEEIPPELVALLDERAGKRHSADGPVLAALAEILTRYDQIRAERLRHVADGRRAYMPGCGDDRLRDRLREEADMWDTAARVAEGDTAPLYGLLPLWMWTDDMDKALRTERCS